MNDVHTQTNTENVWPFVAASKRLANSCLLEK
jgi:hypothetical protein